MNSSTINETFEVHGGSELFFWRASNHLVPIEQVAEEGRVRAFQKILKRAGYTVTVRTTKGLDIDAACGQLGERPENEGLVLIEEDGNG